MPPMTREEFERLSEAFGGQIARWPASAREAAALLLASEPDFAQGALARASRLDEALEAWAAAPVRPALREQVVASAPPPARARGRLAAWLWRAGLGVGLAAACAAGLIVGVGLSPDSQAVEAVAAVMNSYDAVSDVGEV